MWLTHLNPPYLPCKQGITDQASWEPESERAQPALKDYISKLRMRIDKLEVVQFTLCGLILPLRVYQIAGPKELPRGKDEPVVICVVRNGGSYISSFLDRHRAKGFKNFIFLENGSTDDTLELLCKNSGENVVVLQTLARYNAYENTMKRYLASRFAKGRWCLCADIDEVFDFPFSDKISLCEFLKYLNFRSFNAVMSSC
jgi:hypothetical protein